jgi:hypothetical protein
LVVRVKRVFGLRETVKNYRLGELVAGSEVVKILSSGFVRLNLLRW